MKPCGLYQTTQALEGLPAGRFVYFHNHGNPGPGIYLPKAWVQNRADFHENGTPVSESFIESLRELPAEGLYRVTQAFFCCEKQCLKFDAETLVQLGHNGQADAILFVPELSPTGLTFPERGSAISADRLKHLIQLKISARKAEPIAGLLH